MVDLTVGGIARVDHGRRLRLQGRQQQLARQLGGRAGARRRLGAARRRQRAVRTAWRSSGPSGAIKNSGWKCRCWPTARTGLSAERRFLLGQQDCRLGQPARPPNNFDTTSTDAAQVFATLTGSARRSPICATITATGTVNSTDAAIVFASLGSIQRITIGAGGPFAPRGPAMRALPRHWPRRRRLPPARSTRRFAHRRNQTPD